MRKFPVRASNNIHGIFSDRANCHSASWSRPKDQDSDSKNHGLLKLFLDSVSLHYSTSTNSFFTTDDYCLLQNSIFSDFRFPPD